jgi:hypothetical protein
MGVPAGSRLQWTRVVVALASLIPCSLIPSLAFAHDQALDDLKQRIASAGIAERAALCIQLSERQLDIADQLYAIGDGEKAQAALVNVAAFSEMARDYAIQAHKHEKQSEIAIRKMARKLSDLKHAVAHDEQTQVQDTINRLEKVRDDLLTSMFPSGSRK